MKLTGCVNITGCGLSPLRESVVLEQIDLSLLKQHENPDDSEIYHVMTMDIVLPILDSIVSSSGCSLKHVLLPYDWKRVGTNSLSSTCFNTSLNQFTNRYNQVFNIREICCSNCSARTRGYHWFLSITMYHYNTCYNCLKHYCNRCSNHDDDDDGDADVQLNSCHTCKKDYCKNCDDSVVSGKNKCSGCRTRYGDDPSSESESEDYSSESEFE